MRSESLIDQPGEVRAEDAIDAAAVTRFLNERSVEVAGAPIVAQFPGGASNLTYLLRYEGRDLILRRPPTGTKAKSAHDVLREARVMAALERPYPYVPKILATCDDPAVIGCDFYVMERLEGIIPRRDLPAALGLDADATRRLCRAMLDKLVALHAIDVETAGLQNLGKGAGYVRRQVEGWSGRWRQAVTDGIDAMPDVVAWLADAMPADEVRICMIHNDFRFDNLVLSPRDPLDIIGVLDWEMATLGDPLMDLGGALAYWVEVGDDASFQANRRQPTNAPGMLTRREAIDYYAARSGTSIARFDFYEVFGLFRLAVIIQQIFRRFVLKQTTNPRFEGYGAVVNQLAARCRNTIERARL